MKFYIFLISFAVVASYVGHSMAQGNARLISVISSLTCTIIMQNSCFVFYFDILIGGQSLCLE